MTARVAYLDCASGAAGDMLLGALVDLGLPLEELKAELRKLPLDGYRLEAATVRRAGLRATKVQVSVEDHGAHAHHHRGLRDILEIIGRSTLAADVRERAAALFRRLGEAEAAVHGTTPEEVHFHEVGAVDAIVDVVGAVIGLRWLSADRIVASPLNLGTGAVTMDHGTFPVPAPATAELVRGAPVYAEGAGERLTPTGAVLVTGYADAYGPLPAMVMDGVGYGAGDRDPADRPNVLRLLVGREEVVGGERALVLETEIDDMPPQLLAPLLERLLAEGALDAYYTPVQMKKGRPGILVTAVIEPARRPAVEDLLFAETTTLGIRWQECQRTVLARKVVPVSTPYGEVSVKLGLREGRVCNAQPEFEDCRRLAAAGGVPVKEVWAAALSAWRSER